MPMLTLVEWIAAHEEWLADRLGAHTPEPDCSVSHGIGAMYNGARRRSIAFVSETVLAGLRETEAAPDRGANDAGASNTDAQAQRLADAHLAHGVGLAAFMRLFKAYRRAYLDLVELAELPREIEARYRRELERSLDRFEVACCRAWEHPLSRELWPICAHCKKIRDEQGAWQPIERYLHNRLGTQFTHGICPDCLAEHYPEMVAPLKALQVGAA